jgi:periplasmic protein CpxP/Spy
VQHGVDTRAAHDEHLLQPLSQRSAFMNRNLTLDRSWLSLRGFVLATVLALGSAVAVTAWAHDGGASRMGGGMHGGGFFGGRMLDRALDHVNATADQRAQIKTIADAAMADMRKQHESTRALRQQMMEHFTAPTVDANAVEASRQQLLAMHDQVSRRMSQAMLDVSRVLTPEQRKVLAERIAKRGEMMQRHRREQRQLDGAPRS